MWQKMDLRCHYSDRRNRCEEENLETIKDWVLAAHGGKKWAFYGSMALGEVDAVSAISLFSGGLLFFNDGPSCSP
ncbi:MAG: hypothetical protein CL930_07205 [Deltaproteobacteria bacterium]|nr:hypothetical protein [Deltaproteobacteria bacterium]